MATKDRRKLQHIHSSIPDKQPTPASLEVGEIAINNAKDQEFISIKNSDDKVIRFSSDGTIIKWIEKKEVMPYKGYVRGKVGPTGTEDDYKSYGITNDDLINNQSNIVIKLNQVAASATTKHDLVNGAKDKYGNLVNPTSDGGLNDGAGFYIDMSRYAMQGANPSFSGITNTCYTNLNGTTKIKGTNDGCGSLLDIDVATENGKIGTATNTIGNADTTISGDTVLKVSGTTTETKKGVVTENNLSAKTENTTGLKTENNSNGYVVNTSGDTKINSTVNVEVKAKQSIIEEAPFIASDATGTTDGINFIHADKYVQIKAGDVTENPIAGSGVNFKLTKDGDLTETITNNSTINVVGENSMTSSGDTVIHSNSDICETANAKASFYGATTTNVGLSCNDSSASTTTNVYGNTIKVSASTANTSATTATLSGNTLTINENQTTINSCGKVEITTDNFLLNQCSNTGGSATFEFCNGYTVKSNDVKIQHCDGATNSSILIKEKNVEISGDTANITGVTNVNIKGNDICISGGTEASMGAPSVKVGTNCEGTTIATGITAVSTNNITITSSTVNITGTSNTNVYGGDVCISGDTEASMGAKSVKLGTNCSGGTIASAVTINSSSAITINAPTNNISGNTYISGDTFNVKALSAACITSNKDVTVGGDENTKIGYDCAGSGITNNTNIYSSSSVTINAPVTNITGVTNISGDTNIGGDLYINIPCSSITSSTVNQALCELADKGVITMSKTVDGCKTVYKLTQNGAQVGYDINVPNDIDDNNGKADRGVNVDVWCNGTTTNVSADTTVTIKNNGGSGTKTFTKNAGTHTLSAYTLSYTHNGFTGSFDPFEANSSFTSPHSALTVNYGGSICNSSSTVTYDTSADKSITIPTKVNDIKRSILKWDYGSVSAKSASDYDPGSYTGNGCTGDATNSITIPKSIDHLTNWNGTCISLPHDTCITGKLEVSNGVYNTSDERLKSDIKRIEYPQMLEARKVGIKQFYYNSDPSKRVTYGVIAQDVQAHNLNEMVYEDEGGFLSVDYTSLMILKIAYLENEVERLTHMLGELSDKIK